MIIKILFLKIIINKCCLPGNRNSDI